MKGLYIHIPFCEHICHYCDFVKRVPKDKDMVNTYLKRLVDEINTYKNHFDSIETIYIGGGTPSMLSLDQLRFLLSHLKEIHPIEYSIEVNPESYTKEKGELFKAYGINRVSLGVQTFNQKLLKSLNRKHTNQEVFDAVNHLKALNIEVSIDLIFAISGQTEKDLAFDLNMINSLNINHVSCYSLILEEKTYFYHQYLKGNFKPQSEDMEANMFLYVIKTLKDFGYTHYEISNFAKHHAYSKHNLIYWTLGEYIGCGLGAHGFIDGYRTYNEKNMAKYLDHFLQSKKLQDHKTLIQDELIFGLRKIKGVHIQTIEKKYQIDLFKTYPNLEEKIQLGLVKIDNGYLRLTKKGLFLGNQVFMVFI